MLLYTREEGCHDVDSVILLRLDRGLCPLEDRVLEVGGVALVEKRHPLDREIVLILQ